MGNFRNPFTGDSSLYPTTSTFSGADIVAAITVPVLTNDPINKNKALSTHAIQIGNLQTISISTHRDKFPVRSLGRVNPRGFTRGGRTIAGSLIFTMLDRESLSEVQRAVREYYQSAHLTYSTGVGNLAVNSLIPTLGPDELPPFDITITMINDSGTAAIARVIGVEIVDDGQVMGIDDLYVEETMTYTAREYYPPYPVDPKAVSSWITRNY